MPLITVQMLEGRPPEVRRTLIREIGEVVSRTLQVPADAIRITLTEVAPDNWGIGSRTMADIRAESDRS